MGNPDCPDFAGSEVPYVLCLSDEAAQDDKGYATTHGLRVDVTTVSEEAGGAVGAIHSDLRVSA